jgi:hypothetical protein
VFKSTAPRRNLTWEFHCIITHHYYYSLFNAELRKINNFPYTSPPPILSVSDNIDMTPESQKRWPLLGNLPDRQRDRTGSRESGTGHGSWWLAMSC